jgi:cytochrome bd-type quinol oxidase subunit 2
MFSKLKTKVYTATILFLLPLVSSAQFNGSNDLTRFGDRIIDFINDVLVPFVFAVALLFFIYGVFLYFIKGAHEDDERKTGKSYILWAIIAFVLMVSVWGIVNVIANGLGFNDDTLDRDIIPSALEQNR